MARQEPISMLIYANVSAAGGAVSQSQPLIMEIEQRDGGKSIR